MWFMLCPGGSQAFQVFTTRNGGSGLHFLTLIVNKGSFKYSSFCSTLLRIKLESSAPVADAFFLDYRLVNRNCNAGRLQLVV